MNRAIKTLLNNDSRALSALHNVFRFDYNKPYQAFKIDGKTTINQILKKIENPENKLIIVINHLSDKTCLNNYNCVAIIDHLGNVDIDYRPHYFIAQKIRAYHVKYDFRDHLKFSDISPYHIIIAQDKCNLTPRKELSMDYSQRFKISKNERAIEKSLYDCKCYISSLSLVETVNSGNVVRYHPDIYSDDINSIIDKSGYIVERVRDILKRKASALKAEREKAAFEATDNAERIEELRVRITARKLELIERFKKADNYCSIAKISEALRTYGDGFASILRAFESLQEGEAKKSYTSIKAFNKDYERIDKMLFDNGRI